MSLTQMAIDHLTDVVITQDFCDERDDLIQKFIDDSGRDLEKRQFHGDSLIVEHELLRKGVVDAPTNFAHDFQYDGMKIDVKTVSGAWFTITPKKAEWYRHSIAAENVTHFAFYKFITPHSRVLIPGDVVSLRFIKLVEAQQVMYNRRKSRYNGFYCDVEGLPNATNRRTHERVH